MISSVQSLTILLAVASVHCQYYEAPQYPPPAPAYPPMQQPAYPASSNYQAPKTEPYTAAIRGSERNVKLIDMPSTGPGQTMTIHVPASSQPLTFILKSRSSKLDLQTTHEADAGSYKETSSEDKPHVMVHTVTRPVLQEIREIIAPYRKVTQEIKPVQETSETMVARSKQYADSGYGYGSNRGARAYQPAPQQYRPSARYQAPAKPYQAPKPAYPAPAPYSAPKPAPYQAPKPAPYSAPKPAAYPAPKPAPYQAPKPAPYSAPKPAAYPAPAPYQAPKPAYPKPQPKY